MYCVLNNDFEGYYDCGFVDGVKICYLIWYGCNCFVNCILMDGLVGYYSCNGVDGSRLCYRYWYGLNCMVFCRL